MRVIFSQFSSNRREKSHCKMLRIQIFLKCSLIHCLLSFSLQESKTEKTKLLEKLLDLCKLVLNYWYVPKIDLGWELDTLIVLTVSMNKYISNQPTPLFNLSLLSGIFSTISKASKIIAIHNKGLKIKMFKLSTNLLFMKCW